jgi:predicted dehydrogenase
MLRLGIAGLGFGAAVQLPVFRRMSDVALVAVAARRREKAAEVAAQYGIPRACAGLEALFEEELDAVSLALPPAETERAARLALARGLAILAEKPLAPDATGAERLAEAAKGRTAVVDFQLGDAPGFIALGAALADGTIGALRAASATWLHHSFAHRERRWGWKLAAAEHGGALAMLGTHLLFLVERLLGRIAALQATLDDAATRALAPTGITPAEDLAMVTARLQSGTPVQLTIGNAAAGISRHSWRIVGEKGSLLLENEGPSTTAGFALTLLQPGRAPTLLFRDPPAPPGDDRQPAFRQLAERFVAAARRHESCTPDFAVGARVQRLVDAVRLAAASGRTVEV